MRKVRRFLAAIFVAGAAVFGFSHGLYAQSVYCTPGSIGCCICEEDFWGYWMCYENAIFGWWWCTSYFDYCELWDPFCVWGGGEAMAPDGSLYSMTTDTSDQEGGAKPRTVLVGDGVERDVICNGVIVKRRYTPAKLAEITRRLERVTI